MWYCGDFSRELDSEKALQNPHFLLFCDNLVSLWKIRGLVEDKRNWS